MPAKNVKILIVVAVLAVAAYFGYQWWENRQANNDGNLIPGAGSNLNSPAPNLVGGSAGPNSGPAVSLPITIDLTEDSGGKPSGKEAGHNMMEPANVKVPSALSRQSMAAASPDVTAAPDDMDLVNAGPGYGSSDNNDDA